MAYLFEKTGIFHFACHFTYLFAHRNLLKTVTTRVVSVFQAVAAADVVVVEVGAEEAEVAVVVDMVVEIEEAISQEVIGVEQVIWMVLVCTVATTKAVCMVVVVTGRTTRLRSTIMVVTEEGMAVAMIKQPISKMLMEVVVEVVLEEVVGVEDTVLIKVGRYQLRKISNNRQLFAFSS